MRRAEWLLGLAVLALIGVGVAYFLRPKEEPPPPFDPYQAETPPTTPTPEQRRAELDDLVQQIEKLGGECKPLGGGDDDDPRCAVTLPPGATDEDLKRLPRIDFRHYLNLSGTRVTDAGLAALRWQTKLAALWLRDTTIDGRGLRELIGCKDLHTLDLSGTRITDDNLDVLHKFDLIGWLDLSRTRITDAGLRWVGGVRNLNISYTKVSRAGLSTLRDFDRLERLQVVGMDWLTDDDLATVGKLFKLESLVVGFCPITDDGLQHLQYLTGLKRLVIVGMRVTDKGVRKLREALPKCRIENGPPGEMR